MSSRKRPLRELQQPQSTPARYAPSTPHAIRALQQRSGAKTRSVRTVKHTHEDIVRPDSIRGVLRQFAKVSAPVTRKRVVSPSSVQIDKENKKLDKEQDEDNDSILLSKPYLTFGISESIEEDDSELPVAPTPSFLPDEDEEQPTVTFQNLSRIPLIRPTSERSDRRKSRASFLHSEPLRAEDEEDQDVDATIMTERGRRAISEEATGRFSRYSFGSIRMSGFGTELEFRRDSKDPGKILEPALDDYVPAGEDDSFNGGNTEDIRKLYRSPSLEANDSDVSSFAGANETFALDVPEVEEVEKHDDQQSQTNLLKNGKVVNAEPQSEPSVPNSENAVLDDEHGELITGSRRQTLLEISIMKTQVSRRKRVKLTRHGTAIPCLPSSLAKRIIHDSYEMQSKRKPKLGKDHMKALDQATEWFFEQVGEDLAAYSSHGRRKRRVDVGDVQLLMKRQKVLTEDGELRKFAKSWLPKDVFTELDQAEMI